MEVKGYATPESIPDRQLRDTARAWAVYVAQEGILYGTREQRIAMIINHKANDTVSG